MQASSRFPVHRVLLAGLAGGFAEILWVALYASAASLDAPRVAHEVTASFLAMPMGGASVALGVVLHLLLALAVAVGFVAVAGRPLARRGAPALVWILGPAALAAVWALNFGLVLPRVNPAFVTLMPPAVTAASKLLFGFAMAAVLTAKAGEVARGEPCTARARLTARREP